MKRVLACLLAAALCLGMALAEEGVYGLMEIVRCREWVSLRELPDAGASRLAEVPLGAVVRNCVKVNEEFYYCEFNGGSGYIKAEYLKALVEGPLQEAYAGAIPLPDLLGLGDVVLRDETDASMTVVATMDYSEGECLRVGVYRKDLTPVWGMTTLVRESGELSATAVFMGGGSSRRVMVYNANLGLTALDLYTGETVWALPAERCSLGGGLCWAVTQDGMLYAAGCYGPGVAAIDQQGSVLWQTDAGSDEICWPYRIEVLDGCIRVCYDSCYEPENSHYEVIYALDGACVSIDVSARQHGEER